MKTICSLLLLLLLASPLCAENWPAWRGADGTGITSEKNLPTEWSANKNIRWKVPLPEACNSTPIIWNDRVFLTQGLDGGKRRALMALDRKTGKQLWQRELKCDVEETTHKQNPPCSSSPVTDGKAVYVYLGSSGAAAYDFDGKRLWHRDLGPVLHRWGNGGSPVLYKNLLILFHGPGTPSTLLALDKRTGKTVWESDEVGINSPIFGSWSTPLMLTVGDHDELIMPLPGAKIGGIGWFQAYDPATGKKLWRCDGLGNEVYAMPIVGRKGDVVVGISGHNGPTVAVRPGGSGDVTDSKLVWQTEKKTPQRIGSGVIHNDHLFIADANGIMECVALTTGEVIWKERVGGNLWGSILLSGDLLYASTHEGDTFVVRAAPKFEIVAKNTISEPTYAALAPSNGELFLRTYKHLYCIAKPSEKIFDGQAKQVLRKGAGEGPAWHPKLGLLFSGDGGINRLDLDGKLSVYRPKAGTNGLLFDSHGRLLACEPVRRRVTRTETDGTIRVLAKSYDGKQFNQPNDITVDSHGRIYFSDPQYGDRSGMEMTDSQAKKVEGVYRVDPDGKVTRIITHEVDRPNGLLVTPDDQTLYVADNNNNDRGGARKLWRFDLKSDGNVDLKSQHLVFDWGTSRGPDGMVLDRAGRLYVAGGLNKPNPPAETTDHKGGVYVFSLAGELLRFVPIPRDEVTNCAFGGEDLKTLFITAGGTLWNIRTTTAGRLPWPK